MGCYLGWWVVGLFDGMLFRLVGFSKDVSLVGGTLGGLKGCWVGWLDVGWVEGMLGGLVGCWVG